MLLSFYRVCVVILITTTLFGAVFAQGNDRMIVSNTNYWSQYFANVNDSTASFLFDDGLSNRIDEATQTHALKIEIKLNQVRDDGLPAREEWTSLNKLIDELEARIKAENGLILGHATYSGNRWLIALIFADG